MANVGWQNLLWQSSGWINQVCTSMTICISGWWRKASHNTSESMPAPLMLHGVCYLSHQTIPLLLLLLLIIIRRRRRTQRAQTSLAEADHYSHIAHCKNVEPWLWKTTHPSKKKYKKRYWIITFTTIWVCYHYYGVFLLIYSSYNTQITTKI